jgi:hypothetical protein
MGDFTLSDPYSSSFTKNSRGVVLEVTEMVTLRTTPSIRILNLGSNCRSPGWRDHRPSSRVELRLTRA